MIRFRSALLATVICLCSGVLAARSGQFLAARQFPTGLNPQAVVAGDFNRDGKTDLAIANADSNTVSILLGNGDGTFSAKQDYVTGSTPSGIAVGDFNGDGYLDLALTNLGSNTISILLGKGDGTFGAKVDYPTGTQPQGLAVGDFNGDGKIDLVVTNTLSNSVGIFLGNGDGTFKTEKEYLTGVNPLSVAVGDFNGDGKLDLAVANGNNNNVVSILLGNGDGSFQNQIGYATGDTPVSVAVGDFNGDGVLDIATADQAGRAVSVLLGKGDGSFPVHTDYNAGMSPTAVAAVDLQGDGSFDLVVTNGNGNTVGVLMGRGDGTFRPRVDFGTGNIPSALAVADFNGDGKPDLAVTNSVGNNVTALLGNGDGSFQTRIDYPVSNDNNPHAVAVQDFNGDGKPDLAVVNYGENTISIFLGKGDGSFDAAVDYNTGKQTSPYAIAAGDFNGDGKPDLAVADYNNNTVAILVGNGDGTFQSPTYLPVSANPCSVAVGDFNGDGKLDLVVTDFNNNTVSVLLGNGDGTFKTHVDYKTGNKPIAVAVADFNRDGNLDMVVVNESDNSAGVMLGNGDGTFQPPTFYSTGAGGNPAAVAVADFNGDSKPDFAVADLLLKTVSIFLGNGDGTFAKPVDYPTGNNPISLAATDLNDRKKFDLVLASSAGNTATVMLGNGDGTFGPPMLFSVGSGPAAVEVGDFNDDGLGDVVSANSISNSVSVLLNSRGVLTKVQSSSNPAPFGESVQVTVTVAEGLRGAGAPTGTVTLKNGSAVIGSGPLVQGQFSIQTSSLPTGKNTLLAVYSGDANFEPRTVGYAQTIQQAGTNISISSSPNPSALKQTITMTATATSSTTGVPTGTVNFMNASTLLGAATLNGHGAASFLTSALAAGAHSITAVYSGDGNFVPGTSPGLNQVVQGLSTATNLISDANPSNLNQSVTFKSTVTSGDGMPDGMVSFFDGTTMLGKSVLNSSGMAIFSISTLTAGDHRITSLYSGNATFDSSTSPMVSQKVMGTPGFGLGVNPARLAVTAGASASATVSATPENGFSQTVTLACASGLPPMSTCQFSAPSVTPGATSTLTITTAGPTAALVRHGSGMYAIWLLIPAIVLGSVGSVAPNRRKLLSWCVVFLVLGLSLGQVACGGGQSAAGQSGTGGTPAGSYNITITGTSGATQNSTSIVLTVQ
jgi:hypothetical protein